jgi:hypothetical protein
VRDDSSLRSFLEFLDEEADVHVFIVSIGPLPITIPVEYNGVSKEYQTSLKKFGAVIGDGTQIGCNAVLSPGNVDGKEKRRGGVTRHLER